MNKQRDDISDFMGEFKSLLFKYGLKDVRIVGYQVNTPQYAMAIDRENELLYISYFQEDKDTRVEMTEAEEVYKILRNEWIEFFEMVLWPDLDAGPGRPSLGLLLSVTEDLTGKEVARAIKEGNLDAIEVADFIQ